MLFCPESWRAMTNHKLGKSKCLIRVKLNSQSPSNPKKSSDFAKLLEQSEKQEQAHKKGSLIESRIVYVDNESVFVDIGIKSEGKVALSEFSDPPEKGSMISVVIKGKEKGDSDMYICSKREADLRKGWQTVKEAFSKKFQVQGKIESEVKGKGYSVNVEGVQLFLPASQLGMKFTGVDTFKSKLLDFKIIKLNEKKKTGVISRKKLIEEINKEKWNELVKTVKISDKVEGTVTKIASFGVFCNVMGIEGLLRQNDISYKKYAPFKQYFAVGQKVELMVLEIDPENNRLALGMKQLFEDPWDWAKRELEKDMVVRGIVVSITNFGVFVELKEGLEGLIHTSELSWSKKPPHPKEVVKKNQEIDSVILDIDFERKRLSLGLKQLLPNPWDNLSANVRVGSVLKGKITGLTKYGAFVEVENGIEGLIHIGDVNWDERDKEPLSKLKKGQVVEYKILSVDIHNNKISCGLKQLLENPYEVLKKKYPSGTMIEGKIKSIVSFGIFIEVEPGFEGLVHLSQIPENAKTRPLEELYKPGEICKAVIQKIEPENKKISLSIKDFDKAMEREELSKYLKTDEPSSSTIGSFVNQGQRA